MLSEQKRVEELEKRVKHLEEKVKMLVEIADSDKRPFTYLALEYDLSEEQIKKILDLMDKVRGSIRKGEPMHHSKFEEKVYQIVPSQAGNYHFAEDIVSTLNKERRWQDVYMHMKKSGMNI